MGVHTFICHLVDTSRFKWKRKSYYMPSLSVSPVLWFSSQVSTPCTCTGQTHPWPSPRSKATLPAVSLTPARSSSQVADWRRPSFERRQSLPSMPHRLGQVGAGGRCYIDIYFEGLKPEGFISREPILHFCWHLLYKHLGPVSWRPTTVKWRQFP